MIYFQHSASLSRFTEAERPFWSNGRSVYYHLSYWYEYVFLMALFLIPQQWLLMHSSPLDSLQPIGWISGLFSTLGLSCAAHNCISEFSCSKRYHSLHMSLVKYLCRGKWIKILFFIWMLTLMHVNSYSTENIITSVVNLQYLTIKYPINLFGRLFTTFSS